MARHGIYQKWKRFLIKSFDYICEGLVLVHRHFMKPRNVSGNLTKNHVKDNMHRVFEYMMEIIGWLQIVASPLLIGLGIAAFIYFPNPTETRMIIAIIVAVLGLVIGIVWANRIWKTKGTMWFVSQISATPDLDNLTGKETEKNKGSH